MNRLEWVFFATNWVDTEVVVTLPGGNVKIPDTQPERRRDEWYESQGSQPIRDRRDECQFERSILKPSSHLLGMFPTTLLRVSWKITGFGKESNA